MSGHPLPPNSAPLPPDASEGMTNQEIDVALSTMAHGSACLLREFESEQRRMEELNAHSEAAIQRRVEEQGSRYEADTVLLAVRLRLATRCAKNHRDAAREFVCWWLDSAIMAWRSAVNGTPLPHARVGAAAPDILMSDGDLTALPRADERTRQLVELGMFLGTAQPGPVSGYDDGVAALTADLAARSGLFVGHDEAGNVSLSDDGEPEARRRRLWGDFWLEHGIPALPEPNELDLLLDRAPGNVARRLRRAVQEVIQAVMAGSRIAEMESDDAPWTPAEIDEYDRLSEQLSLLTNLLAFYAQVITDDLPAIRAATISQNDICGTS